MAENLDPNSQIKEIDLSQTSWEINGKKYYLISKMPPRRYVEYLKILPEAFFNTTFAGMHSVLHKIWANCTRGNDVLGALHSSAELAYNQIKAIADLSNRNYPKILEFCAVILVREGEDLTDYDQNIAQEKIEDFMGDTYSMDSFFLLAMHSVPHFSEIYSNIQEELKSKLEEVT